MRDVEERFRNLRSQVEEHATDPNGEYKMWAECDGCHALVEVEKPELPEGWTTGEHGELCPDCQARA